ncbi:MAG: M6 family metalloprotease domain-containing protein [Phycisphaerae bacterium]|nr:M6 family metalloprotease domain-containing protein [Phycisphaerae bacterium]
MVFAVGRQKRVSLLLVMGALLGLTTTARAHPIVGETMPFRQPDGTVIEVRVWGDEFYAVAETLDGYTLVEDPATRAACYARLSADGTRLEPTGIVAGQNEAAPVGIDQHIRITVESAKSRIAANRQLQQAQKATFLATEKGSLAQEGITIGSPKGLCLIVDFSDDVATIPASAVADFCNKIGYTANGNNGSVRDYFYDISGGKLTYTNYVPTAYHRAKHPKTYYTDQSIDYGTRARELITEALDRLKASGFNFGQCDTNSDGTIDALNCLYAGSSNSPWSEGLWPHASWMSYCAGGVCAGPYQITDMGSSLRISTFCHENGHMLLGWPDLYDYDYDSTGVGHFCLMAFGTSSTNPCRPCAYMRNKAGWCTVTELLTSQANLPLISNSNAIYKYSRPSSTKEYFLLENRQRTGRDVGLPDDGLAIWHVDENGSNDNNEMTAASHYKVTLVQADGLWDMENNRNSGDSNDLWSSPTYTLCTPDSSPNTRWWDGTASKLYLKNVSVSGSTMTFTYLDSADCNANNVGDETDIAHGTSADCNGDAIPDECQRPAPVAPDAVAQDSCAYAQWVGPGKTYTGSTAGMTNVYFSSCGSSGGSPDVWYKYSPYASGTLTVSLCGSSYDTVVSVHSACPSTGNNRQLGCNDNGCDKQSTLTLSVTTRSVYYIRVAGAAGATGSFQLKLTGPYAYPSSGNDCNKDGVPDELQPDADGDGVIDACDACPGTSHCWRVAESNGCPVAKVDYDADGDVDMEDYAHFQRCMTPMGVIQADPDCADAMLNSDPFVDRNDFLLFRQCLSGPGVWADADCIP